MRDNQPSAPASHLVLTLEERVRTPVARLSSTPPPAHSVAAEAAYPVAPVTSVASQPIFRADLSVQGYELLFRGPRTSHTDGTAMTSQVILSALLDIGLERLVGTAPAYLNVPSSMFTGRLLISDTDAFRPDQLILEVPEDTTNEPGVIQALERHAEAGFTLALDDYVGTPGQQALLPYVQTVKVDLPGLTTAQIAALIAPLRGSGKLLLAEKVETREQLETCRELGFDLFQGYLLSRPVTRSQGALSTSRAICLRMLSVLADPDAVATDIEELVKADPALSLRVLRTASLGAAGGLRRSLRSLSEAVVLLGVRRLASLIILTLLADEGSGPPEQLQIAMRRARMCERLARYAAAEGDRGYTVGLLSAMDLLLGLSLPDVLERTELTDDIRQAVLAREGTHGQLLNLVLQHETGGQPVAEQLLSLRLTDRDVVQAYLESLDYARGVLDSLHAAG